jgi:hypothetical protein
MVLSRDFGTESSHNGNIANEAQIDTRRHSQIRISGVEKGEVEKRRKLGFMVPLITEVFGRLSVF